MQKTSVSGRFFQRIEVLALNVFDERHCERVAIGQLFDDRRYLLQTGLTGGAPSSLARNDLVSVTAAPYDNRLQNALRSNRRRELVDGGAFEGLARLLPIGLHPLN